MLKIKIDSLYDKEYTKYNKVIGNIIIKKPLFRNITNYYGAVIEIFKNILGDKYICTFRTPNGNLGIEYKKKVEEVSNDKRNN